MSAHNTGATDSHEYFFSILPLSLNQSLLISGLLWLSITFTAAHILGNETATSVSIVVFVLLIFVPALYSGMPSPFEGSHRLLSSFAGSGIVS